MMRLKHCVPIVVALLSAAMSPRADAFFDPPWITPAAPRAGESVFVSIHGGVCDAIFSRTGYPQITQSGNSVRIVEYGDHLPLGDDLCVYGTGTLTETVGAFSPGSYTLTVDLIYDNYPFGFEALTLGVVPFAVAGVRPAAPVPVLSALWKWVLLMLLLGVAAQAFRVKRRTRY